MVPVLPYRSDESTNHWKQCIAFAYPRFYNIADWEPETKDIATVWRLVVRQEVVDWLAIHARYGELAGLQWAARLRENAWIADDWRLKYHVLMYFSDNTAAVHFKLRWYD